MEDARATVVSVDQYPLPYYCLRLQVTAAFAETQPGQFVMVQIGERLEPFLRRAFSVHDVSRDGDRTQIDLLGKVVGRGTDLLARLQPGEPLQLLGPLGRGFRVHQRPHVALVAGGVGSAALLMLARQHLDRGQRFDFFYGGRSSADLCRWELFRQLTEESGGRFFCTTEDGSLGEEGLVTTTLETRLVDGDYGYLYACGPMALLHALAQLSRRFAVDGEAALETPMGCGFGACLGCAVPHVQGHYALCCKDGPVFGFAEVRW